jgi:hypothetical protein
MAQETIKVTIFRRQKKYTVYMTLVRPVLTHESEN